MPMSAANPEPDCRRTSPRATIARASTVRTGHASPFDVSVEDLSETGFRFSSDHIMLAGSVIRVGLAGAGQANARIAWQQDDRHGCVFEPALTRAQVAAAFTHSDNDPAVASLPSDPEPLAFDSPTSLPRIRIKTPVNLLLIVLGSLLSWAIVIAALRNLHF
jgi:hypothetical protein